MAKQQPKRKASTPEPAVVETPTEPGTTEDGGNGGVVTPPVASGPGNDPAETNPTEHPNEPNEDEGAGDGETEGRINGGPGVTSESPIPGHVGGPQPVNDQYGTETPHDVRRERLDRQTPVAGQVLGRNVVHAYKEEGEPEGRIIEAGDPFTFEADVEGDFVVVKQDVYRRIYPGNVKRPTYVMLVKAGTSYPIANVAKNEDEGDYSQAKPNQVIDQTGSFESLNITPERKTGSTKQEQE